VVSITPAAFYLPSTLWIGGWVDLRAGLDTEARRKILCLCQAWIQLGEECDRLLQNVKLTLPLALTSAEKVNLILLILYSWSINVTVEFVLSEYVVKKKSYTKTCGISS
jgi:hypothetical protein